MVSSLFDIDKTSAPSNATPFASPSQPAFQTQPHHRLGVLLGGLQRPRLELQPLRFGGSGQTFHHTKSRSRSSFCSSSAGWSSPTSWDCWSLGPLCVLPHYALQLAPTGPSLHFCNFMGMSMVFYGLCPLLLGTTMAVERFVGINRPFARSTAMSNSRRVRRWPWFGSRPAASVSCRWPDWEATISRSPVPGASSTSAPDLWI